MRASLSQVILAQEPDFNLGGVAIRPSKLQVVSSQSDPAAASRDQLQPRIMQVLVALAHRRGEVVSRDEMMAVCWGGFAVSDDAINRCIARLRRLSENHGGFTLETIPRVGYQLNEVGAPQSEKAEPQSPTLPEASMAALLEPNPEPVVQPVPAVVAPITRSWMEHHGRVAAIAFALGVLTTTIMVIGAHYL